MAGTSDAQALLLTVSADTSKALKQLDALNKKLSDVAGGAEKASKQASEALNRGFTGEGFGKALDKIFDSSRLAVLEEGSAKLRIFGSALEPLGPLGIGAAAGVAAVGIALEEAHKAAEFAEGLEKTAKRLHVTTDALQEYRFAIKEAGGEEAGADEALEAFSITLGKAQAGVPRALKAFQSLGFSREQVKSWGDVDTAVKAVTEHISGLRNDAQKDAAIDLLGLNGLKPLIEGGIDKMVELREEARKLGVVMDADLVKRGADANRQFEILARVIDIQLKSAFVDLAPVLVGLLGFVAELARSIGDVVDEFRRLEDRRTDFLKRQIEADKRQNAAFAADGVQPAQRQIIERNNARIATNEAELARRGPEKPPKPPGNTDLAYPGRATATHDNTPEAEKKAQQALDEAEVRRLEAIAALTGDILERADFEKAALDAELKKQNDALDAEKKKIDADKTISNQKKAQLSDEIDQAELANIATRDAKAEKIRRDAEAAVERRSLDDRLAIAAYYDEILQIEAGLSTTAKERRDIELKILQHKQDEERAALKVKLDAEVAAGTKGKSQRDAELASQADLFDAQRAQTLRNTETSLQRFTRESQDPALIAEKLQDAGVKAFEGLADGLADAIVNAKSLGDVAKNVFRQLIAEVISQQIRKIGVGLFGSLLEGVPHFASGTDYAPGGLSLVGERGPELVSLPRGASVIPNSALSGTRAMAAGSLAPVVHQTVLFDNRGAVIWEDAQVQLQKYADNAAVRAGFMAYQGARKDIPANMAKSASSRLGS